jgi:hypothetical protein
MKEYKVKIERQITVTQEDIDDIMCSALEGGINYWCRKAEVVGDYLGEYASEQISRGGLLKLYDSEEDEVYVLTLEKLLKGIQMAIYENCYAEYEWFNCDGVDPCQIDADVADVIIQFALFNEVMFA